MIYKGNVFGRYYKSLGDCVIKNQSNTTLETIPWYVEQKLYKGGSLIYPSFDTSKTYDDVPAHNYDCAVVAFCESTIPTPITLLNNSMKFGAVYTSSPGVQYGTCSGSFDLQQTLTNKISIAFDVRSTNDFDVLNAEAQTPEYLCLDYRRTDIVLVNYYAHYSNKDTANLSFNGTFLTDSNVTSLTLGLYKASTAAVTDEVAKYGTDSGLYWSSIVTPESANVIASQFQHTKLWHVSVGASCSIPNNNDCTHIAPRIIAEYDNGSCHVQAVNLSYALHLSHS